MRLTFIRSVALTLLSLCLLLLNSGCGINSAAGGSPQSPSTPVDVASPTSAYTTACPAPGVARPAHMPPITLGAHQAVVSLHNDGTADTPVAATLKLYDLHTGATRQIARLAHTYIQDAQLTRDGQWLLLNVVTQQRLAIQLIRLDGSALQTLYCAAPGTQIISRTFDTSNTQLSPNQKMLAFLEGKDQASASVRLLTLATGQLETLLAPGPSQFTIRTWIDNARIYVSNGGNSPAALLILDTRNGPNQSPNSLKVALGVGDTPWNFDSSYDATKLFSTRFDENPARTGTPVFCQITSYPVTGGSGTRIFSSTTMLVVDLRVVGYSSDSLLLSVSARGSTSNLNGLWKMRADGTGLVRLTHETPGFNLFTQYPWSNFSRDSKLYALGPFYGSLQGGPLTRYAPDASALVGWTTV